MLVPPIPQGLKKKNKINVSIQLTVLKKKIIIFLKKKFLLLFCSTLADIFPHDL